MTVRETEWQRRQRRQRMRMEHAQLTGGACDLCGAMPGTKGLCGAQLKRALDEDHDHRTGAHRGFVCARANRQLWAWVTPEWLRAAAIYLETRS